MSEFEESKREFFCNFKQEKGIDGKLFVKDADQLTRVFTDLRRRPELHERSDKEIADGLLGSLSLPDLTTTEAGKSITIQAPERGKYGRIIESIGKAASRASTPKAAAPIHTTTAREEATNQMPADEDIVFVESQPLERIRDSDTSLSEPSQQRTIDGISPRRIYTPYRQASGQSQPPTPRDTERSAIEEAGRMEVGTNHGIKRQTVEKLDEERVVINTPMQPLTLDDFPPPPATGKTEKAAKTHLAKKEQAKILAEAAKKAVEEKESKRNTSLEKALGMPPARTTDDLDKVQAPAKPTVDAHNRDLGRADPEVARKIAAEQKAEEARIAEHAADALEASQHDHSAHYEEAEQGRRKTATKELEDAMYSTLSNPQKGGIAAATATSRLKSLSGECYVERNEVARIIAQDAAADIAADKGISAEFISSHRDKIATVAATVTQEYATATDGHKSHQHEGAIREFLDGNRHKPPEEVRKAFQEQYKEVSKEIVATTTDWAQGAAKEAKAKGAEKEARGRN